ncbi:MAG TPA: Rid family detoxifying hydrolase [Aggregatilineales bacterium]|nr:Rid family detoxifying hydrolase [Aggregatilineales bacterium]
MNRQIVHSEHAPKAVGPYSQAIIVNGLVFAAGQAGVDPATGNLVEGGVAAQTAQVLRNLDAVLTAAGSSLRHAVKASVFLTDMAHFPVMNAEYAKFFPENPPARTTVAVAALPLNALVEIDLVALLP